MLKGKPKFWGVPQAQGHSHFFFCVWFYDGPWQTPLHAKFEVASPRHCTNIIGEPKILRSYRSQRPPPLFPLGVTLLWALANPICLPNLKSLASGKASGSRKFQRAPLAQGYTHFFFYLYGNIQEFIFRGNIRTSSIARWKAHSDFLFMIIELFSLALMVETL